MPSHVGRMVGASGDGREARTMPSPALISTKSRRSMVGVG